MGFSTGVGVCPTCGKRSYTDKARAKRAARQMRGRLGRLQVYPCGAYWHLGHAPKGLIRGYLSRQQVRDRTVERRQP